VIVAVGERVGVALSVGVALGTGLLARAALDTIR
jgi:hypothetical protein